MNIYKNGYNLDNIDAYMAYERIDERVDEFFQYAPLACDAYKESLYDSISEYDRCYY